MLNRLIKIMTLVIMLSVIQSTSAVFFSGEVLKKNDITVVILGDVHADTSFNFSKTKEQAKDLQTIIKKYNPFFIFENSSTYGGNDLSIKNKIRSSFKNASETSILHVLNQMCIKQNISHTNAECRYALSLLLTPEEIIKESNQTIKKLSQCMINPLFQKYLDKAIEEYKFYISKTTNEDLFLNLYRGSSKLLNLNIICEFHKALQNNKHKLFIISVGAAHMQDISEMLENIFQLKKVLQKNTFRSRAMLNLPNTFDSGTKQSEFTTKMNKILNEYALDLPQFFEEALKAPAIRSRM